MDIGPQNSVVFDVCYLSSCLKSLSLSDLNVQSNGKTVLWQVINGHTSPSHFSIYNI